MFSLNRIAIAAARGPCRILARTAAPAVAFAVVYAVVFFAAIPAGAQQAATESTGTRGSSVATATVPGAGAGEAGKQTAASTAIADLQGVEPSADPNAGARAAGAAHHHSFSLPDADAVFDVLTLRNYNTRLVVLSTALLGFSCGLVGSFLLLRKRSLMGDALSHATLPGIAVAFITMVALGGSGKYLPGLLVGAALSGTAGFLLVLAIRNFTKIKDDTAMGIVLSVSFGAGIVLLGIIQNMPSGSAAGLESFIYGKTASMVFNDFIVLCTVCASALAISLLLFKELRLICFDEAFASAQGWPVRALDICLLSLVTAVTVAGLQAVGLILIIAFLITPPATARLWTQRFSRMLLIAALTGAASGWIGASISALTPRLPAGAVIVLTASALFVFSLLASPRGVIARIVRFRALQQRTRRQHMLRAAYELLESATVVAAAAAAAGAIANGNSTASFATSSTTSAAARSTACSAGTLPQGRSVRFGDLLSKRSWSQARLGATLRRAQRDGLIVRPDENTVTLTEQGLEEARRITRNHRLWELYLIRHADIAPAQVDRDADAIEHILGSELIRELEEGLAATRLPLAPDEIPQSPHPIR